jgi:hypothetical protein
MFNNTFEDYKKAIKAKYEKEIEGGYSNNLNPPTTANLRNLCLKRFNSNTNKDDLDIFLSFFEFPFDGEKKNLIKGKDIDKLKTIRKFFLGITESPTEDTIHFAAILVDFQPRPFNKFKLKGINQEEQIDVSENDKPSGVKEEIETLESVETKSVDKKTSELEKKREITDKPKSNKRRYILGTLIACLLGIAIYFACSQKQCMQWSNDHFEKVDCDLKANGFIPLGKIEPYDESKFGLKKIKVCDTTTCFINGEAIVWYAKISSDKADFFNTHGRHPENNKPLRPVTDYIKRKYGESSTSKK